MSEKKNNKKPPKKRVKKSAQVLEREKSLKKLTNDKSGVESSIKSIIDQYNALSVSNAEAEKWMDRLPLETLKELQDFLSGKKKNFNLSDLKTRSDLRRDRSNKIEQLEKIENEIQLSKIDLLLAKVNALLGTNEV